MNGNNLMESKLQIIERREVFGKDFKIYGDFENPLFLAKDVAEWIEYDPDSVNKLVATVDEGEKLTGTIFRSGQNREVTFLTEDGLYEVLMQSRKPIAKQFKREVKAILRQIRRTGGYIPLSHGDTDMEILSKAFIIAQNTINTQKTKLTDLLQKIEQDKPKVAFADAVSVSKTSILVGEMAKILKQNGIEIGQNRLFKWLRVNGYLVSRRGTDYNMPTQYSMERELFEIKETSIAHSDGHVTISKTPKITGKGRIYFADKFKTGAAVKKAGDPA